jgi:hypothetical protein
MRAEEWLAIMQPLSTIFEARFSAVHLARIASIVADCEAILEAIVSKNFATASSPLVMLEE